MYSLAKLYVLLVMAVALFAHLINSEPILLARLQARRYQAYCCFPGCITCSGYSCQTSPCYGVVSLVSSL
ncbi:uncharacterized protein F4807DRAFT_440149 [Annulohypoxylon truncatum]|uniref:uncharacterized protein n=1 Tax=Annulohypoxylon truncatum TaxID=327061 RepID=UPI002007E834|nr:uncharacterized protein F4807DRAFT_440149 [Annulohypoxylon truncatum]KAI1206174.1 hypothetical protein F4807DRAFT_440149 [Annulohypoxylon truncatum]